MKQIGKIFSLFVVCCFCFSSLQAQVVNYALKLSGDNSVICGQVPEINGKSEYAVQFLMAPQEWTAGAYIFKRGSDIEEFSARLSSVAGNVVFKIGTEEIVLTGVSVTGWTQISLGVFKNGADTWINGVKTWNANSNLQMPSSNEDLVLGKGFKGRLDEFRVWNTSLPSAAEEELMFQNTVNKFHPKWESLVLYYKFDQEQCADHIVDYKFAHHGTSNTVIQREEVTDNNFFRYRVVTGYSSFNRHCDRLQIDKDMHLLTNDLIFLNASVNGRTGEVTMTALDDASATGGGTYMATDGERAGIAVLDGTGTLNLGKAIQEGEPSSLSATVEGWFYVEKWVEGAVLFEQKENDSNLFGIYLGNLEKKQLIVKADGWQMECDNVLSPEQWQHLAVTMDPTSSRNPMRIYVNNQNLKGTIDKPADGVMYTLKDIDADAVVGTGFIGKMDELMVWRNARTTFTSDMDGTLTSAVFPGGGYDAIFFDGYWKFDREDNIGYNSKGWKAMIEQTRELYKGYRGYKIRIGLISSDSDGSGNKLWPNYIGNESWRANIAKGVEALIPYCDGVDIDLEWLDNNPNNPKWASYGEMVKAIRAVVPNDKIFSVSLHPVSYTMPLDAIDAVDYVTFQNYGPRKSSLVWSAYSSFYTTAVNYGYPAEKIRLSMATTAVMSDNSGKNVKGYKDLDFSTVTAESNTGTIGGVDYTFNGVKEVQKKMQLLVDNNTGGCMYFDMGNDVSVQDELSLIRALSMTIHSNVDTLVTKVSTDPVGIEEKKLYPELNSAKVSVYPNPSDGNFQVDLPFSGEAVCDLFSMTGNKVYSTIGEKQIRFSLSGILSTGLYILKIDSSEGQATTKVQIK